MSSLSGKIYEELYDAFTQFERDESPFSMTVNGVWIWELIRGKVFQRLLSKQGLTKQTSSKSGHRSSNAAKLLMASEVVKNALSNHPWKYRPCECIILGRQRRKLIDRYYWDIYTDYLIDDLPLRYLALEERYQGTGRHFAPPKTDRIAYFDLIELLARANKFRSRTSTGKRDIRQIGDHLAGCFNIEYRWVSRLLKATVVEYYAVYSLLQRVLDHVKPGIIVQAGSGFYKRILNKLAREREIPTIELQHGLMGKYHITYDFPYTKDSELTYFPAYYFLFGQYWHERTRLPIPDNRKQVTGFPHYSIERERRGSEHGNAILFISQNDVGREIGDLAVKFAARYQGKRPILFKLYPDENYHWRSKYPNLTNCHNVHVISGEQSMHDVMYRSAIQIGAYSTSIFEGLGYGLKTFIFKTPFYPMVQDLVENGTAMVIQDCQDLLANMETFNPVMSDPNYFWEPQPVSTMIQNIQDIYGEYN